MAADMAEQPDVLRRLIAARSRLHREIRRLTPTPLRGIDLVGRGSSENAALYGRSLLETLTLPDVPTITIATTPNADLRLPSHLPEPLAAVPAAVRAQQLALETARRRGLDPDQPPRIRKVTLV